jgi:hypothetical protein
MLSACQTSTQTLELLPATRVVALPAGSRGCHLRLGASRMTTKPQPDDVGNADAQVLGVIFQFVVEAAINAQAANDAGAIVLISRPIGSSGFGDHKKTPRWGDRSSFD